LRIALIEAARAVVNAQGAMLHRRRDLQKIVLRMVGGDTMIFPVYPGWNPIPPESQQEEEEKPLEGPGAK